MGILSSLFGTTNTENAPKKSASDNSQFLDRQGHKVMPEIDIVHIDPKLSNDKANLELWGTVYNTSSLEVEIIRIELLGQTGNPGRYLKPGEKFEIRLYRGRTPKNDAYSRAKLSYKISENDDYFEQKFFVDFDYEDGYYIPKSIDSDHDVRDI